MIKGKAVLIWSPSIAQHFDCLDYDVYKQGWYALGISL
jgi:hypothetical protein